MAVWNDIYFRESKGDPGNNPGSGTSSCFDIITRQEPYQNPSILIGTDKDKNNSQNLNAGMNNYIYVRAVNNAAKTQNAKIYLYYSKASLLLYPTLWQQNIIKTGGGKEYFEYSAKQNEMFVCADDKQGVFFWNPALISGDHYCLVSRAVTSDHPAVIPKVSDVKNFGKFISQNRSYGWRNVTVVDSGVDFSQTVSYDQGEEGATMHIILSCKNAPVGSEVAFDCPTAGPSPLIHMNRTKITEPNQDLGIVCDVPANFHGDITYYFWGHGKQPGENFSIELNCVIFVSKSDSLYCYAKHYEELGFALPKSQREAMRLGGSIGPTYGLRLGQYATVMKK